MERIIDPLSQEAGLAFNNSRPKSAASWGAIFAGALVATAVSLVLLALGSGFGLASASTWSDHGISATAFTVSAAIWLIVMQWISAGFGGYIAGRLRTRWVGTHPHEIFFRDTAQGLVAWALATVAVAAIVAMSVSAGIGSGLHAASGVAAAGAHGAMSQGDMAPPGTSPGMGYGIDKLFRPMAPAGSTGQAAGTGQAPGDSRGEATHILLNYVTTGTVSDADRTYLVSLVAARTGVSDADAQKRVDDLIQSTKDAEAKLKGEADVARKDAAETAIYTALSMLVGAFIASVAAALGGRQRDEHI